ncbi:MAG: HAMP domain-containing histidine kinase [Crocinitomicaceae bacterium]|nr:HAMP domain-containing histidine kinase [Crocinitomicaceae bacterium]
MKLSYKQQLFLYFGLLFTLFTICIIFLERSLEKKLKTQALEDQLEVYTTIIDRKINNTNITNNNISEIQLLFPNHLRITLINFNGEVTFDNSITSYLELKNHKNRPEIIDANLHGKGSNIRKSASNHHPYLYFAKKTKTQFVRVALPYNIQTQNFLKATNGFIYIIILFFVIAILIIHKITERFGLTVKQLRDFAVNKDNFSFKFPNDEFGEIGKKITENYIKLEDSQKNLILEKQKLLKHIHISEEGICFISDKNEIQFYNGLFIQYLNFLADYSTSNPNAVFELKLFHQVHEFISKKNDSYFETQLKNHGKIVSLRITVFEDMSYEIILNDITQQEKTRQLKQEITGNIAHELRTPIAGIRAYLETVLEQSISDDKKEHFIKQAYLQTISLSELIKDMSYLSKIEEAPKSFPMEQINLNSLLLKVELEVDELLKNKQIKMNWNFPNEFTLKGNYNLIYSIFRNLVENTIRYAGGNIQINITLINQDTNFYYFSYYDSGVGIKDEKHLNRIFERFYRIHEGRTRDSGGTGLGLSIVKNAIIFHKGSIIARNRKEGGLEFLFQLSTDIN